MNATRHALSIEPVSASGKTATVIRMAESREAAGNWYLAGEEYRRAADSAARSDSELRAILLCRAATCFDIAGQCRAAARAYFDSAMLLQGITVRRQYAGELFNRAALQFAAIKEAFNAGDSWRRAGEAFASVVGDSISTPDNIPPIPAAAHRNVFAGECYSAGGDAFELAGDNAMWQCMAYWQGGRAFAAAPYGDLMAFRAYRKALSAAIKHYRTHQRDELRRILPLTDAERTEKIDPLLVMEEAVTRSNKNAHRDNPSWQGNWAETQTHREMAGTFHEFYLGFSAVGNAREAGAYRAAEKDRMRRLLTAEHRYAAALLYWLWRQTAGYGESLTRWLVVCFISLVIFALFYGAFGLVAPVMNWFDYFYFSVITFTSLGYGDIHPVGIAGKLVACAEITAGLAMFGMLLTFIGNRFQRG